MSLSTSKIEFSSISKQIKKMVDFQFQYQTCYPSFNTVRKQSVKAFCSAIALSKFQLLLSSCAVAAAIRYRYNIKQVFWCKIKKYYFIKKYHSPIQPPTFQRLKSEFIVNTLVGRTLNDTCNCQTYLILNLFQLVYQWLIYRVIIYYITIIKVW